MIIPAYLKKYPEEVVKRALEKFPLEYEMKYDEETRLPLWEEDKWAVERHWYIIGYMDGKSARTSRRGRQKHKSNKM